MSLRNRARSLQKKTGLTYQQALARLRALAERPATLRRQTGWSLEVCDRYLVDGHAPILVQEGPSVDDVPIEVLQGDGVRGEIRTVCEALRLTAAARAVALVDLRGRVMVHVGRQVPAEDDVVVNESVKVRRRTRYAHIAAARATLTVTFTRNETSLGLVRLRARKAVEELERLLDEDEPPMMPPASGGGGTGGIPNELRVVEPVPEERPKPKPTPIGRRRKRER